MASVQLSGPRVVAAAKPATVGGLLLTPSLAVPTGRRARGLVVRAATVVSPKVTYRTLLYIVLGFCGCRLAVGRVWWPVFGSLSVGRYARMRNLKILRNLDECCAVTKLIVVVGDIARKTENPLWSKIVLVVIH
jgi:hypothetical protein